jgi:serine/threonine protein kinase/tetratricopeptide (TPR) repeat protein
MFYAMSSLEVNACLDEDTIAAFVAGELDACRIERVDAHLATCQDCLWMVTAAAVGASSSLSAPSAPNSPAPYHERFERRHLIAQGGMGAVYYGYDREAGASVAIKQLKPGVALSEPGLLGRFIREAEILRRLDHPNIVKMIASVTVGSEQQIVMEYVSGGSLRQLLRIERRLPVARAAAIVLELADALSRAHHLGVIHRDIKPENVLLTKEGTPKLGDFGLAMLVDAGLSTPNAMLGTIAYLSPEALSGQVVDARADLWALGVMMFEMITGRRPFEAPVPAALVMAILHQPTPDLEALCPDTPVELLDLLYRLLTKDRNQRIASARQVGAELEALTRAPDEPLQFVETQRGREGPSSTPDVAPVRVRLPAQTTPFIGRESELAELALMLGNRDARAVTIIGPGGMGKSRLALEAARRLAGSSASDPHPLGVRLAGHASQTTRTEAQFASLPFLGVFFVDLAPLGSPELIVPAVAEAVGFQFKPGGDPKRQLLDYFREKRWLLLMDNFEHVVAGAGFVNELLQTAEGVKVLSTSRERLGLRAEAQFILSGMSLSEGSAENAAAAFSAVELFVDSARRTRFGFDPTPDEAAEIATICRLVHGMPLGIVLAASWIDTLSLSEIAGEIGKNIDFLQSEAGDLPSRQHSIRAVFDHSWGLLGPEEQAALARVSIFRGGFTRAAAEVVAGASLRTLASLVAKSLLRRVPATGRYEIHELLRQYAEARLSSTPAEYEAALDRMATFYSGFSSERRAGAFGPRRQQVFREVQADLVNIHRAWHWMLEHGQAPRLLLALHTLGQFYQTCRSRAEGAQVLGSVVNAFGPLESGGSIELRKALGLALAYQALFCDQQGRKALAVELATRAVLVFSDLERDADRAMVLVTFAWTCAGVAEQRVLVARLEEGLEIQRAGSDGWWLVRSLVMSVRVYVGVLNDLTRAEACLREAIAVQKSLANDVIVWPDTLASLGLIKASQGHRREGCELLLEALRIAEVAHDVWTVLVALQFAARAHRDLGDYVAAEAFVRRCIGHARDLGSTETVAWCHLTLGGILRDQGRFDDAIAEYEEGARGGAEDAALIAKAQLGLGEIALSRGEYRQAKQYLLGSLELCERHGIRRGARDVLEALGYLACQEGSHDEAYAYLRRAFELARGRQRPSALIGVIVGLGWWCARSGQPVRAAELASLARHHPATAHPVQVRRIEPLLRELQLALGPAALDAAVARGKSATLERVFETSFPPPREA